MVYSCLKIAFNRQSAIKHLFFKPESTRNYSVVHCIHYMQYTLLMFSLFRRALENAWVVEKMKMEWWLILARRGNSPEYWPGCLIQCRSQTVLLCTVRLLQLSFVSVCFIVCMYSFRLRELVMIHMRVRWNNLFPSYCIIDLPIILLHNTLRKKPA